MTPFRDDRPPTRGPALLGCAVVLGFLGGFGAWATLAPLAEAAIAPGIVKVEGQRRTLQHLEGGIVRDILVRDGDAVRAGQPVMRLDDVQAAATLAALRAQRGALLAQGARLAAEMAGAAEIAFPPELAASDEPRVQEALTGQRALFEARRASLAAQVAALEARQGQSAALVASAQGQLAATRGQLELVRQEEAMRRSLTGQGLARLPELLAVQRARAALEGQEADLLGQIARARASLEESASQIRAARDTRRQEAGAEARDAAARLAEAEERLRAAEDVATRREILAPEDGTVVNLRVFTMGAVLRPGDPVMDLVPARDRLVAEVSVQPTDIDVVHPGMVAEVRLPAFRQRLVPLLEGRVSFVAADVSEDPRTRAAHYRAFIVLEAEALSRLPPQAALTPGMPVEAHILVGHRSFWRYLTQPLRDSFARAFREG